MILIKLACALNVPITNFFIGLEEDVPYVEYAVSRWEYTEGPKSRKKKDLREKRKNGKRQKPKTLKTTDPCKENAGSKRQQEPQ